MDVMMALVHYFVFVLVDGDYRNDWLTHLPVFVADDVEAMGRIVALLFGR